MNIDSHHHFWQYSPAEYGWISDQMSLLRRDFLPPDLEKEIKTVAIDGVVSVQARQTLQETEWLLELSDKHDFIKGVVGWVPLAAPGIHIYLDQFATCAKLKAVRHVVQDEPDERFILREDFNHGIQALAEYGLVYDILIFERHLPATIEFVDRHPNQRFVLDHLAKPRAKEYSVEPWRENIRRLAERDNVFCKLSGLATEADWNDWTEGQLSVYLETVVDAFGPHRVMFGSDWPVCLLATTYARWHDIVMRFCDKLSKDERNRVLGGTAVEAYGL